MSQDAPDITGAVHDSTRSLSSAPSIEASAVAQERFHTPNSSHGIGLIHVAGDRLSDAATPTALQTGLKDTACTTLHDLEVDAIDLLSPGGAGAIPELAPAHAFCSTLRNSLTEMTRSSTLHGRRTLSPMIRMLQNMAPHNARPLLLRKKGRRPAKLHASNVRRKDSFLLLTSTNYSRSVYQQVSPDTALNTARHHGREIAQAETHVAQ